VAGKADPILSEFFTYFNSLTPRFRDEIVAPLLNKLDALVKNPHIRVSLGQGRSSFSFSEAMDRGQFVLCNLPKKALGEASSRLGAAIFTKVMLSSLERRTERKHAIIITDVSAFTTGINLASALASARHVNISLILAVPSLDLISKEDRAAIFAHCETFGVFRTSAGDAKIIAPEMGSDVQPRRILELPNRMFLYRGFGEDMPEAAVLATVAEPFIAMPNKIRQASLIRWGRPRHKAEARIMRHLTK
jgi:hypothetical protein